jgi:hypothetical protein
MANQYKWSFPALEAYPQHEGESNVVFTIHYRLDGDDGQGNAAGVYGTVGVSYSEGEPFTPYAELTEEQVTNWVVETLGEEQVVAMKSGIDAQIEAQINPQSVVLPPPWAQVVPEVVPEA